MCVDQDIWYFNYTLTNESYHNRKVSVIMEALTLVIIITMALSANVFAIVGTLRSDHGKKIHLLFILNLFVTDVGITLSSMLFTLYDVINPGYMKCFEVFCRVQNYIGLVLHLSNASAVCLIAIHRFFGVVLSSRITIQKCHAYIMILIAWTIPAIIAIFPISGVLSSSVYTAGAHNCTPDWNDSCFFFILIIIILYGIALPIIVVCYVFIIREIRRSEARLRKSKERSSNGRRNSARTEENGGSVHEAAEIDYRTNDISTISMHVAMETTKRRTEVGEETSKSSNRRNHWRRKQETRTRMSADKKVALMCGLIVSTSFACWTPYFIVHATCAWDLVPTHGVGVLAKWLSFFNAALDPIIYVAFNKRLRSSVGCTKKKEQDHTSIDRP